MYSYFTPVRQLLSSNSNVTDANRVSHSINPKLLYGITIEIILHPAIKQGRYLFDLGTSDWMLRLNIITISQDQSREIIPLYKSPHDLWTMVRERPFYKAGCFTGIKPDDELMGSLTPALLYCSEDNRTPFRMRMIGTSGESIIEGFWKLQGFHFTICANDKWLWLNCFSGGISSIEKVTGEPFQNFDSTYYFPFKLDEWLLLPSYTPDLLPPNSLDYGGAWSQT